MLALINTLYVYVWDGESECLRLLILRVCEGMGDLLLAPNNTICLLRKGTGTH